MRWLRGVADDRRTPDLRRCIDSRTGGRAAQHPRCIPRRARTLPAERKEEGKTKGEVFKVDAEDENPGGDDLNDVHCCECVMKLRCILYEEERGRADGGLVYSSRLPDRDRHVFHCPYSSWNVCAFDDNGQCTDNMRRGGRCGRDGDCS